MAKPIYTYPNSSVKALPAAKHGSAEWQLSRAHTIGASEVGAVLGISKWGGLLDVVRNKRNLLAGIVDETDNEAMRFGRNFESFIIQTGMERLGLTTMTAPLAWTVGESITNGIVSATPDALVIDVTGCDVGGEKVVATFEAKVDRSGANWQEVADLGFAGLEGSDIRLMYYLQCQAQLLVTGCEKAYLCVATGLGYDRMHLIEIAPDAEAQSAILQASQAAMAWVHDTAGRWPAPSDADSLASLAATIQPKGSDAVTVVGEAEAALEEYVALNAEKKRIEDRQEQLKKIVLVEHGTSGSSKLQTASGVKSSFTGDSTREAFDAKAFEEAEPETAAKYRKTVTRSGYATITAPRGKKG